MYEIIDKYIDKLMTSDPARPLWNIESIKLGKPTRWNYIDGCMMTSLIELYKLTGEKKYIDFVKKFTDYYVHDDGSILGYEPEHYSTDDVCESKILFDLDEIYNDPKYKKAIDLTFSQVKNQPRTKEGNFWHKKIYPNQVWLDGFYMIQPFYTRYQTKYGGKDYHDIISQYKNARKYIYDEKAKLYHHGWDSSKKMFWADPVTGCSKEYWLRALGWFMVSLIDVYGYMSEEMYDEYHTIKELFKEIVDDVLAYQDNESKMFWQVVDQPGRKGNYLETSGSSMIAYAILKGVRLEALPKRYQKIGMEIFEGISKKYLTDNNGDLNLGGICLVAGLGPEKDLRRDGTFEYYISEPIVENDAKGTGPLIMAYTEMIKLNK